jgi:hypothetical protein
MASVVFENNVFKLVTVDGKPDTVKIVWKVPEDQRELKIIDGDKPDDIHPYFEGGES